MPHAGTAVHNFQYVDPRNSTDTPLAIGETYTGAWVETLQFPTVILSVFADQHCLYYIQYSPDTVNVDSTLSFEFHPERVEPPKRLTNTRRYYRVVIVNNSGVNQSVLRCQTILGHHPLLNAPLNGLVTQDSDAVVTRSLNFEDEVSLGRYQSIDLIQKTGRNGDIDTGTVPEDIWSVGGAYTGFPAAAEEFVIVLSNAGDVGATVTFNYLESTTSIEYKTAVIVTTGTTTNTGITGIRSNEGIFNSGSAANLGTVTLQHITTTANVFWQIRIANGKAECASFTIPYNNRGIIRGVSIYVSRNNTATISGSLVIYPDGASPFTTFSGSASNNGAYESNTFGGSVVSGFADLAPRVTSASVNNVVVTAIFSVLLINED